MAKLTHSKLVHSELTIMDLSPTELAQLPNPPLLIDVRSSLEYFTGHAPNARNLSLPRVLMGLSLTQWFLPRWFRELSKEQPIAVICLTAHRRVPPGTSPEQAAIATLQRELGVDSGSIEQLITLNSTGWAVNSSFSNQKLYGFVAHIHSATKLANERIAATYSVTPAEIHPLLEILNCLQCRAVLLEWILNVTDGGI